MNLQGQTIRFYCAEQGPWQGMRPVLEQLHHEGVTVQAEFLGYMPELIQRGSFRSPEWVVEPMGEALVIFGSCQGMDVYPEVGQRLRDLLMAGRKVLLFEDSFGSSIPCIAAIQHVFSQLADGQLGICVTDDLAREHLIEQVPWLPRGLVEVTGNPELDSLAALQEGWESRRTLLRSRMGIQSGAKSTVLPVANHERVILIAGGQSGSTDMISLVHGASAELALRNLVVVVRTHPTKGADYDNHLVRILEESHLSGWFRDVLPRNLAQTTDDLLPAVDMVLSPYTNTARIATMLGLPVAYCGTDSVLHSWQNAKHAPWPPHLVQQGAAWDIRDIPAMKFMLETYFGTPSEEQLIRRAAVERAQRSLALQCDGHAADRIIRAMEDLFA